ncbi:MAG: fatty acid kinase fatty acid binding subunit [Frankiales bacterium]|nr:fatty acid kinase fatty acid binding subunit [Frankiales bacterium]
MTARVAVVTDSTAYLPDGAAEENDVRVVPLQVTIGDRHGDEGIDIGPTDVEQALRNRGVVMQTSRPSPLRFREVYDAAIADGAAGIVVITISAALSGTLESAEIAGKECGVEVHAVDSRSTAMGLGFAVLAAARVAAGGASAADVAARATTVAAETRTLFCVATLENLRRGGRIGAVRALVGTALSVKPILHIKDGEIGLLEKVRTASRARARLVDLAVEAAGDRLVDVALHYVTSDAPPDEVANQLRERLPKLRSLVTSPLGAAIATHVGSGVVGVVVAPA